VARRKNNAIDGQFSARTIEMLESPAWRVLSLSAHKVFDRICIELAHHGGNDNGRLPVTYGQFMEYGIDRHAIAPAIRELEALGFVEVTQRGKPSAGDLRWPNFFRLTCVNSKSSPTPSHEWRRLKTRDDAELMAKAARKAKCKKQNPGVETPHCTDGGNPHRHAQFPVWKSPTTSPVGKTHTTSISRVVPAKSVSETHSPNSTLAGEGVMGDAADPDLTAAPARLKTAMAT
jgi:hypothetical protein